MALLKPLIKWTFRTLGLDVKRQLTISNPTFQLVRSFNRFNIDLIFDIGANAGQFATKLRSFGFNGNIVSFEPLSEAHRLLKLQSKDDAKWQVHDRGAIGDSNGVVELNIAGNSVSSSILPMEQSHSSAATNSAYTGSETVPVYKLDSIATNYSSLGTGFFLKIDVQGFEWQVLDGARETLKEVKGILIEMSLIELYEGQRLWKDVIQRLEQEGFTLWALQRGFTDARDGRTLQVDGIFYRTTKPYS